MYNSMMIRIADIVQNIFGWGVVAASFLLNYFGETYAAFGSVLAVVTIDGVFGVISAVKRKNFILSYLGRETMSKIFIYLSVVCVVHIIEDTAVDWSTFATPLISALICAVELWSILGHVSILKPDLPLVALLRNYLLGEIARKLDVTPDEADKILSKSKDDAQIDGE